MARVRIKIDVVVDFKERETLPLFKPLDLISYGLRGMIKENDQVFIEPDMQLETTLLGPMGKRMATKKDFTRDRSSTKRR